MGLVLPSRRKMTERRMARRMATDPNADAKAILDKRYASGQITKTEYDQKREDMV
jgi:uncharacterized membrane protein